MNQSTANERYRAAGVLFREGRHSEALEILDELVAATPGAAPLHFHRSRCLRALRREAEAITALDRVLELSPDYVPALLARVELARHEGETFDALPLLQHAVRQEPDNARALFLLAEAELMLAAPGSAEEAEALAHLERSLELDPGQAEGWACRAEFHANRALTEDNGEHVITDLVGMRHDRRALEQALHDYQRAAELEPGNRFDRRIAQLAERLGDWPLATACLDRMLARMEPDAPGRGFLIQERERCAAGEAGARDELANLLEQAGASEGPERTLEEDSAHALTHAAALLVRQGHDVPSALDALIDDESPEAVQATTIAFQLYNYAHEPPPDLMEVDAADYPGYQRRHADACEKALAPLGYVRLADAEALGITSSQGSRTLIRIFTHPEYGSAAAFALKPKWPGLLGFLSMLLSGKWKPVRMLECVTRLDSGLFLHSRAAGPDPFDNSAIERLRFEFLPAGTPPQGVAEHHIQQVQAQLAGGARVVAADSLEAIENNWQESNELKAQYRQSIGYVTDAELRALLGAHHDTLAGLVRERLALMGD